jgi:phosphoserine phosphatase
MPQPVTFLVDVDNTLLDNDRIQQDLRDHLERRFGVAARDRYWTILEALFAELGYRDYLGALQRFRVEHPSEVELLWMSSFLLDYPFADRLFPGALEVLKRLRRVGQTVILAMSSAHTCLSISTKRRRSMTWSGATRPTTTSWWTIKCTFWPR